MKHVPYFLLLLLASLLACQKPTDAVKPIDTTIPSDTTTKGPSGHQGVVYDRGTPVGQPVQKVIGPEGGTLASADGTLKMTIPAGAVSKATTFSMQPVTPTLPGLMGGQSFRLLPEGQPFAQPVTLQYHYEVDSLDGTSAQALFMAYQGSDGYWKALMNTELNETTQTLTVTTKHFSDWGAFAQFSLDATPNVLMPGQSATLSIVGYYGDVSPLDPAGTEVELAQRKTLANPNNIRNWQLKGLGKLSVEASQTSATYLASTSMGGGSVSVSAEIYNFLPPSQAPRKGATGKVIVMRSIRVDGAYFQVTIGGKLYDCKQFGGTFEDGDIHLTGTYSTGNPIGLTLYHSYLTAATIPYWNGDPLVDYNGKAVVSMRDNKQQYDSWYFNCAQVSLVVSPGRVVLEAIDNVKGDLYARGSFTSTIYYVEGNCVDENQRVTPKTVNGQFRVKLEIDI